MEYLDDPGLRQRHGQPHRPEAGQRCGQLRPARARYSVSPAAPLPGGPARKVASDSTGSPVGHANVRPANVSTNSSGSYSALISASPF
jgi:hypothetical protein